MSWLEVAGVLCWLLERSTNCLVPVTISQQQREGSEEEEGFAMTGEFWGWAGLATMPLDWQPEQCHEQPGHADTIPRTPSPRQQQQKKNSACSLVWTVCLHLSARWGIATKRQDFPARCHHFRHTFHPQATPSRKQCMRNSITSRTSFTSPAPATRACQCTRNACDDARCCCCVDELGLVFFLSSFFVVVFCFGVCD